MFIAFLKRIARAFETAAANRSSYSMSRGMRERMRAPSTNVDGTPMVGRSDIRGRGYGSTGSDSWRC